VLGRLQLSGGEKSTLAEIASRLGRKALAEVAVVAKPDIRFSPQSDALVYRKLSLKKLI